MDLEVIPALEAEMEDFETIALGLKNPAAKAQKRNLGHIPLSNAEMALVAALPESPLYNVELRIMEGIIETLETEHFKAFKNKDEFDRTGIEAVAARVFYERYQKEVAYQAAEFKGNEEALIEEEKAKNMTPEEFYKKSLGIEN